MNAKERKKIYTQIPRLKNTVIVMVAAPILLILLFSLCFSIGVQRFANKSYKELLQEREQEMTIEAQNLESGISLQRQILENQNPDASDAEIESLLTDWLRERMPKMQFTHDAHATVSDIRNKKGGDGYAVVVADSSAGVSEGFVRTTKSDAYPYNKELHALLKSGSFSDLYETASGDDEKNHSVMIHSEYFEECGWIISLQGNVPNKNDFLVGVRSLLLPQTIAFLLALLVVMVLVQVIAAVRIFRINDQGYRQRSSALQSQVDRDVLTEANSRRKGAKLLQDELERQQMLERFDTAIMMIDMDYFKEINDRFGHNIGDKTLQEVVKAVQSVARTADDIIRWGGDEFIGIFRGMAEDNLPLFEQRIKDAIAAIHLTQNGEEVPISASIGTSFFHPEDDSYLDVIDRADKALYADKGITHTDEENS